VINQRSENNPVFLENSVHGSPGSRKIELRFDSSGSPCRIFFLEDNDSLFRGYRDRSRRPVLGEGLLFSQSAIRIPTMPLKPSHYRSFGGGVDLPNLFGTSYLLFVNGNCLCLGFHCRFHPPAPARCSRKAEIHYFTVLGHKLWHATLR